MTKNKIIFPFMAIFVMLCAVSEGGAYTINQDNGHAYEIFFGRYTWDDAQAHALNQGYHLATITSQVEQTFVQGLLSDFKGEFWLGAQQIDESIPDEGWSWVTGEEWEYTNWEATEANDFNGIQESHLGMWSNYDWEWNDEHGVSNIVGFVAEISSFNRDVAPVPEPATMLLLGTGLIGLAGLGRKKLIK